MGLKSGAASVNEENVLYLDTCMLVYLTEGYEPFQDNLHKLWNRITTNKIVSITSELSLLEALVLPIRQDDQELINRYELLYATRRIRYIPIGTPILRRAARLRADNRSLRTPDAIHLATALESNCTTFLTNDTRIGPVDNLQVLQLANLT